MKKFSKYVGLDVHKETVAVSVAEVQGGEVRYFGEIANTPEAIEKLVRQLRKGDANLSLSRGGITKTGNGHVRRVLVEAAWTYRHQARKTAILQRRAERTSSLASGACQKKPHRLEQNQDPARVWSCHACQHQSPSSWFYCSNDKIINQGSFVTCYRQPRWSVDRVLRFPKFKCKSASASSPRGRQAVVEYFKDLDPYL